MEIVRLGPGDEDKVSQAAVLFDDEVDAVATRRFLDDDRHILLIAYWDGAPAGFISAIEMFHPDKSQAEVFLYELGVDEDFRRRGVASALIGGLLSLSEKIEARGVWVLTERTNAAAIGTYEKTGGGIDDDLVMFTYGLSDVAEGDD